MDYRSFKPCTFVIFSQEEILKNYFKDFLAFKKASMLL